MKAFRIKIGDKIHLINSRKDLKLLNGVDLHLYHMIYYSQDNILFKENRLSSAQSLHHFLEGEGLLPIPQLEDDEFEKFYNEN